MRDKIYVLPSSKTKETNKQKLDNNNKKCFPFDWKKRPNIRHGHKDWSTLHWAHPAPIVRVRRWRGCLGRKVSYPCPPSFRETN